VETLLNAGADTTLRAFDNKTALCVACERWDATGPAVVELLLRRTQEDMAIAEFGEAFRLACQSSTVEMIRVLERSPFFEAALDLRFQHPAEFGMVADDVTCVMIACKNLFGGPGIIRYLGQRKRDLFQEKDNRSKSALYYACRHGTAAIVRELIAVCPELVRGWSDFSCLKFNPHDPLAIMQELKRYTSKYPLWYQLLTETAPTPECLWGYFRCGIPPVNFEHDPTTTYFDDDNEPADFEDGTIVDYAGIWPPNRRRWYVLGAELSTYRDPGNGKTLLHTAAEKKRFGGIQVLINQRINPWLPCREGKLAIDCTKNLKIREALLEYMKWGPYKKETDWMGPMFRKRCVALLLVFDRLKMKYVGLSKEIALLILAYVAEDEPKYLNRERAN
jgi:hypothetical protein